MIMGYADLKRALRGHAPGGRRVEATRWGFRLLLGWSADDILQPNVGWCGGLTELIKISGACRCQSAGLTHGSSVLQAIIS